MHVLGSVFSTIFPSRNRSLNDFVAFPLAGSLIADRAVFQLFDAIEIGQRRFPATKNSTVGIGRAFVSERLAIACCSLP